MRSELQVFLATPLRTTSRSSHLKLPCSGFMTNCGHLRSLGRSRAERLV